MVVVVVKGTAVVMLVCLANRLPIWSTVMFCCWFWICCNLITAPFIKSCAVPLLMRAVFINRLAVVVVAGEAVTFGVTWVGTRFGI